MKRVIIMGATSGLGRKLAERYAAAGHVVGIAGRRADLLESLRASCPERIHARVIDVTADDAATRLAELVEECGGMDLYVHSSGIGHNNPRLLADPELQTVGTNAAGFTRMVGAAFNHFVRQGGGHIAAITSIAGTRGLGAAPAYSATKKFQSVYLTALAQQARIRHASVGFTDIRPGFVRTALIEGGHYPLQMDADYAARKIFHAIEHRRRVAIIDWRYALLVAFWKLIPSRLWERIPVYGN